MFIGLLRCAGNYWRSSWRSNADRGAQIRVPLQAGRRAGTTRASGWPPGPWLLAGADGCMRVQCGVVGTVRGGVQTHLLLWWALGDQTAQRLFVIALQLGQRGPQRLDRMPPGRVTFGQGAVRSEEHTSELQ